MPNGQSSTSRWLSGRVAGTTTAPATSITELANELALKAGETNIVVNLDRVIAIQRRPDSGVRLVMDTGEPLELEYPAWPDLPFLVE